MNPLTVETIADEKGRCAVVRTNGYINNLGAERIEQEIDGLIGRGFKNFVINFEKSPIINSMGLSILIGVIEKTIEPAAVPSSRRCSSTRSRTTGRWRALRAVRAAPG